MFKAGYFVKAITENFFQMKKIVEWFMALQYFNAYVTHIS